MTQTIIVAVTGSKGGIGKTTTAVSVSDALVRFHNQKVLLVETDAQASGSFHLGLRGRGAERNNIVPKVGLADLLRGSDLKSCMTHVKENMEFLAGGPDAKAMIEEHAADGIYNSGVKLFRDSVINSDFDICIIDAPPGIDKTTAFTWMSSDFVILPFRPNDLESIEAIRIVNSHIDAAKAETGISPKLMGVIATNVDRRTRVAKQVLERMREVYSSRGQFLGQCSTDVNMVNALGQSKTIFDFAPASRGALHYKEITNNIFAYIKRAQRQIESED